MSFKTIIYLSFSLFFLLSQNGYAQDGLLLSIETIEDKDQRILKKDLNRSFRTEEGISVFLDSLMEQLYLDRYYTASLDTIYQASTQQYNAALYVGGTYEISDLDLSGLDSSYVRGPRPKSIPELMAFQSDVLAHYERLGFPFVQSQLKEIKISENTISGKLGINPGNKISLDTIILHGPVRLRSNYLNKYLGLEKGDILNGEQLLDVERSLDELPFLKRSEPSTISFLGNQSSLNVFAKPKNASRFDFIFGVIPSDAIVGQSLFVSLDMTAEMVNKLGMGEYLFFEFERLRPEQQRLVLKANYPYIMDLPIALDGSFSLFRNELDFLNVDANAGIQYLIDQRNYVKVLWNFASSRIIEVDTTALLTNERLPDDLDVVQNGLGLEMEYSSLDYKFSPRKGVKFTPRIVGGRKEIIENFTITDLRSDEVDFVDSYDSLKLDSYRLELAADFSWYIPLSQRGVLKIFTQAGWRDSGSGLFRNELFQIGGYKLLRGFDEASIYTPFYIVPGLEYRLLLTRNSYFSFPFVDFAFVENPDGAIDFGYGLGGGLSFETKIGMFNFTIASGKLATIPLDFGRPKAHFGFISLF